MLLFLSTLDSEWATRVVTIFFRWKVQFIQSTFHIITFQAYKVYNEPRTRVIGIAFLLPPPSLALLLYFLFNLNNAKVQDLVISSELYKDWNDTSIRPAVWLSEAKLMAAGGSHVWQKHASVVVR